MKKNMRFPIYTGLGAALCGVGLIRPVYAEEGGESTATATAAGTTEDILACPPPDLLDLYWVGTEVRAVRAGLTADKNRLYGVATAAEIPNARKPLVPVVDSLITEEVIDTYGAGPDVQFYELLTVCGVPEEESGPD